ncbi:MAG: DUF2071 domain-containing protein [Marinoscillum sp.]
MSFLKAEWRKLVMINYEVDPQLLQSYVPEGTALDFYQGRCYVSLVGFMFLNTRILGVRVPFHINFEEVNLRFYVKRKAGDSWKRGVVFIKEIVPRSAITFVANTFYKEHYETCKMNHVWKVDEQHLNVSYQWVKDGQKNEFWVKTDQISQPMVKGAEEEFIAEHYWGYSKDATKTVEYEVKHEPWEVYPVSSFDVQVDFQSVYGKEFAQLNGLEPSSVLLAEGSAISVEGRRWYNSYYTATFVSCSQPS